MIVESNYAIAIATLSDWLKTLAPVFNQWEVNQNQSHHVRVIFPALWASGRSLLEIVIGS